MSIGQKLEKIATKEDLFPELSAEEKERNKTVAKIVTNADKIRAMTDEELAEWCYEHQGDCSDCPAQRRKCMTFENTCKDAWLEWLKQEVQDDRH